MVVCLLLFLYPQGEKKKKTTYPVYGTRESPIPLDVSYLPCKLPEHSNPQKQEEHEMQHVQPMHIGQICS